MHVADTMLVEVIPVVVNKPCGAGSFCNLVAVPENKIHIAVEFLTVFAEVRQISNVVALSVALQVTPGSAVQGWEATSRNSSLLPAVQNCCGVG